MLLWAWAFGVRYGDMSETIEQTIMAALEAAAGKSVLPADIARRIAGHDEKAWSRQMKPVRAAALSLARQGKIVFLRKGKRVDPNAVKGLYRLSLAAPQFPCPSA